MRIRSKTPLVIAVLSLLALFGSDFVIESAGFKLVKNFSPSEKPGLYIIEKKTEYKKGELVRLHFPEALKSLAKEREWLREDMPLLKRVAAVSGDIVCNKERILLINNKQIAEIKKNDREGRPIYARSGCYKVQAGQFLPLGTNSENSFDGRYFGVIADELIIGQASPLLYF